MGKQQGPPPDYVEVNERIVEFRAAHPDGVLQAEILPSPVDGFVVVKAYAYRTPDDERPGTGLAWEPIPGKTNFTRDSELMNAETSAWGRAIIAVGAADAKRGIASANEVRNRQQAEQSPAPAPEPSATDEQVARFDAVCEALDVDKRKALSDWMERNYQVDLDGFANLSESWAESLLGHVEPQGAAA